MSLVSRRASYGLRAVYRLADLAEMGQSATIAELAESECLPRKYLEQVVLALRQAGVIESRRGPGGGCRLARPADAITVGDVVRALDGDPRPGHCLDAETGDHSDCPGCWGYSTCAIRELWGQLAGVIDRALDAVTIADLRARQRQLAGQQTPDYQI
ncbi:MAG: Rrf2 family transcriptional regulator [Armatimonadetes bacterium]|nr:Rrf2 family transcriptional regulator [Armatimonadota bacterium]